MKRVMPSTKLRRMALQRPSRHSYLAPVQKEDRKLTSEEKAKFLSVLLERAVLPALRGEVDLREVLTPPGGWERIEASHPNIRSLPVSEQWRIAIGL